MQLDNTIPKLPAHRADELHEVILTACLAYLNGSDWRGIFASHRRKSIGAMQRAYKFLENATPDGMERLCAVMERDDW